MTTQTLYLIDEYLMQGGYTPGIDAETLESEAALVAAAPDLLAALIELQQMVEAGENNEGTHEIVREAITKATGN
jgi:erythromycin esterase-like protein